MTNHFTKSAESALHNALLSASDMGHTYIGSEHILLGLISEAGSIASKVLEGKGISRERIYEIISGNSGIGVKTNVSPSDFTPRARKIIEGSEYYARQHGSERIGTEHILLAISDERDCVAMKVLAITGIGGAEIKSDTLAIIGEGAKTERRDKKGLAKDKASATLSSFGRDLTALARTQRQDPIIGRDRETMRVMQILSRKSKNNPCLIGEPGVGKTAIVEGLAQKIAEGKVPEPLKGKTLFSLDLSLMIAGAKYRGEFEERMKSVMEEVSKNDSIILFIDEIHTIIGAGAAEGAVDAANILKPALARGEIQVIGATTAAEYHRKIEKDSALERRFQSVIVGEPSEEETAKILEGLKSSYERHHGLTICEDAIEAAISLSCRYITDRFLPDKAIDLLDEACAMAKIKECELPAEIEEKKAELSRLKSEKENAIITQSFEEAASIHTRENECAEELAELEAQYSKKVLNEKSYIHKDDIAKIINEWTGIPTATLTQKESERLDRLESEISERVIGQKEAAQVISRAIQRSRVGLKDPKRPIGSFMLLGPTGVGKTEMAKALASIMFGSENSLIKIDMSEFMEKHSVSKLIGSPPGYVGYEEGGYLTEKIKRRPYSLILLDEIEKAHPDVFNLLLQILDDGVLTDSSGVRVNFKNTIIIMTSNIGASKLTERKPLGFQPEGKDEGEKDRKSTVLSELKKTFSPEFLNRIDEVVVFNALTEADTEEIAKIMLSEIADRIKKLGIEIEFDESAVRLISRTGYDKAYGARPLKRTITHLVEDALSRKILSQEIFAPCRVKASESDGALAFELI
ncbi:MAG: ATP-dependent Clp protease ATP-binding subunit [Clostridia bacterium]|nr:ATP-dependent Clp protease ATP-binding subunit [Clostridia bacterium]